MFPILEISQPSAASELYTLGLGEASYQQTQILNYESTIRAYEEMIRIIQAHEKEQIGLHKAKIAEWERWAASPFAWLSGLTTGFGSIGAGITDFIGKYGMWIAIAFGILLVVWVMKK